MADLIDILESFNRKERFFLISHALNGRQDEPKFTLSENFRRELGGKMEVCIPKDPEKVFVGMDYHLDWVAASIAKWEAVKAGKANESVFLNPGNGNKRDIRGNQEDIDLLVAFKREGHYHLILVEAKAYEGYGYASFDRGQLESKADRLVKVFGNTGRKCPGVTAYFCLLSHSHPQPRSDYALPWHKDRWMPVSLQPKDTRRIVERCKENGEPDQNGDHFHIRSL